MASAFGLILGCIVCALLAILLAGCVSPSLDTPSPSSRVSVSTKQKVPLKIGVIFPEALKTAYYKGNAKHVGVSYQSKGGNVFEAPVTIKVGESSADLFQKTLPQLFETVEFLHSETEALSRYQLILVPRLSHATASHEIVEIDDVLCTSPYEAVRTGKVKTPAARAQVTYDLIFKDRSGTDLVTISQMGTGYAKPSLFRWGECGTRGASPATSMAFEAAQAEALVGLINKLRDLPSSPALRSYLQAEAERQARPSDLSVEVRFDDSRALLPNSRLDASEEAELVVAVRNQGAGSGYGVVLAVSADYPQVSLPSLRELGEIPPGQSREVRSPVKAGLALPSGTANLLIEAKEKRGYHARTVKLVLPTARLERPSLTIVDHIINDGTTGMARGNGNRIPENGETIEVQVRVKNAGPGAAAGAILSLATVDPGIEVVQKDAALGVILPNQTVRGVIALTIPRTYTGKGLNLALRANDGRGEVVGTAAQQFALPLTSRASVLAAATRILHQGLEVQELTNGQAVEVEVTPQNVGTLDAEQVAVRVGAGQSEVVVQRDRAEIGPLRAGAGGVPQRFELTIPRGFVQDRLPLTVELSQRGFASQIERLDLPVKVQRPVLAPQFTIIGAMAGEPSSRTRRLIWRYDSPTLEV